MRALIARYLPGIVLLIALLPGLGIAVVVHLSSERRAQAEFERSADLAIDRITSRLDQSVVVLRAARGLLSATRGTLSRDEFVRFLDSVDITGNLTGIQGVGFARMLAQSDGTVAEAEVARHYGIDVAVRPESQEPWITPIVLLEPVNDRNTAALGFDMYSEQTRRSAMDHAVASGEAQMTGPVQLVQEITDDKQTGFLIYLPFKSPDRPQGTKAAPLAGFLYAPFRGGDLIKAALSDGPDLPVSLRVTDTGAPSTPLFDGLIAESAAAMKLSKTVATLGRQWQFDFLAVSAGSDRIRFLDSGLLAVISILFATAAAYAVAARQAEVVKARELAQAALREADYRALSLQEMKHRIKNHIARIQSIARQSARGVTDIKAFLASFDARLQSMSAAQEILAGTAAAEADVGAILARELRQCRDASQVAGMLHGPRVALEERQAQAFALVVHELVTNAMKYGGLSSDDTDLQVNWAVQPASGPAMATVTFDWAETAPGILDTPDRPIGFGSRLIEASLKGELSGTIDRKFSPGRLHIRIVFPLQA